MEANQRGALSHMDRKGPHWQRTLVISSGLCVLVAVFVLQILPMLAWYREQMEMRQVMSRIVTLLEANMLSQQRFITSVLPEDEKSAWGLTYDDARGNSHKERVHLQQQYYNRAAYVLRQGLERVRKVEEQVGRLAEQTRDLRRTQKVGQHIFKKYMKGVGLLEGAYTFEDATGKRVRYLTSSRSGTAERRAVSMTGRGPVAHVPFAGTGFVVGAGLLLTNRHIAEPWWGDRTVEPFLTAGLRPVLTRLRVFFPGVSAPSLALVERVSDKADVALLRFDPPREHRLPMLVLEESSETPVVGDEVLVIGYPAGIDALVARTGPETLEGGILTDGKQVQGIAADLSQQGLVRPLMTWGHLSDIRPHALTHDALTTKGASGSPIINSRGNVIGINRAMFSGFSGVNFAVPIAFAFDVIKPAS